jgi:hypothetical protein
MRDIGLGMLAGVPNVPVGLRPHVHPARARRLRSR